MSIAPIVPNLPASTTAFANKYARDGSYQGAAQFSLLSALNALPLPAASSPFNPPRPASLSNTITPLANFDLRRANRGSSPLTARQSALALQTLRSGNPATPPRRQGFLRSALSDLRSLVGGIPKLPLLIYNEARQLSDVPGLASRAVAESSSPIRAVGNLASVPGFRMIPGAFVAQTLAGDKEHGGGQGLQGLAAHPLFTALDILPIASGAAKFTPAARAAEAAYMGQVEATVAKRVAEGFDPSTAVIPNRPRPLQTAITRTVNQAGEVVPNPIGQTLASLTDAFYSTGPGRAFQATFKERQTSRLFNRGDTFLREAEDFHVPTESLRPPVPGGADAMARELSIRTQSAEINRALQAEGILPNTPEMEAFYTRAVTSRLPDGTPMPPELMVDLPPAQRAIMRMIRDHTNATAAYTNSLPGTASTRTVNIDGMPEVYNYNTARVISKAQTLTSDVQSIIKARQLVEDASAGRLTADQLDAAFRDLPVSSRALAREMTRLEDAARATLNLRNPADSLIPMLRPLARTYPTIPRLIDHLQSGRWSAANRDLAALADTRIGQTLPVALDDIRKVVSEYGKRDRILSRTAKYTDTYLERVKKIQSRVESRATPARFDDLVQEQARAATRARIRETFATAPDLDRLIALADEGIYDTLTTRDPRFIRWVREDQAAARQSWKALRDAGHDPIYFTRVTPQQARRQPFIRLSDAPTTLQSVRSRMMDATPYVRDAGIAVTQSSLDILQRRATQAALDDIGSSFGRTRASLVAEYEGKLALGEGGIPARAQLDKLISDRYVPWEPARAKFGGSRSATFNVESPDAVYVPRVMVENIQRMYTPSLPKLTAAFDPVMKVFRTSVLPLALRWQVNNLVSGGIIMAVNDPRAFLELPAVIKKLWGERHELPAASERILPAGAPPSGFGTAMSPEMRRWDVDATSPLRDRVAATAQFASGSTLRKLYDTARESRLSKIPTAFNKALEKSYGANQFVDDVVRASLGQSAKKRLLARGVSSEVADAMTASTIRRVFMAWDEMTPMERSVMRSLVPFYGFAAYATKFALRYPFDHPFRVSILNSLTRAELTDALTGLPEYVREMIFLGDPRANGVTRALNVSPFNPFAGVPSMFTVAGFLGQLNPVVTGVLESVGVDVQQGGPQLYPELRYDPETGRLQADPSGNVVSNIFGNITPQLQGISSLLGFNGSFNATLQRDPAAAGRMLLGQFGLPILYRDIDVGDQLIKSELARYEDQENARKEALRSGNLGMLGDFPGLAAYGEQIKRLQDAGMLDQLRPAQGSPGARSNLGTSPSSAAYAVQAALTG